ncbi:MAG: prevent-host-death protein [Streptococcaceae bacterium]|nr:prevent-host-death protein [Streptococcaceae bacterium]MCL2680864.1 prevent-host-death protein [Streptococcaceae bacterium]MCL2858061.1 prevent-host-death protein [Streptococcaceae bacterium]
MENTAPVSDLRSYNQTLSDVREGSHLVLTKNGKAKYAVLDIDEYKKTQATIQFFKEMQKGYDSLKNEPLVDHDELMQELRSLA